MLRRRRKESEADRARGKNGGRRRHARERHVEGSPPTESAPFRPFQREATKAKARARRKARFLKAAIVQGRAARSGRTRRIRRPSALRALPRRVRALLRNLA